MASFTLPPIHDNPDGGWGPSSSNIPEQFKFKDIPYAPYSKSDKLGRFADWNDTTGDTRQTAVGLPSTRDARGPNRSRRDGAQAFGSGTASAFAYFHVEDESSFSLVDNKAAPPRRGGGFIRGRATNRGGMSFSNRGVAQRGGRGGFNNRGGAQRGGRKGWRDWEKVNCVSYPLLTQLIFLWIRQTALVNRLLQLVPNGPCWRRSSSIGLPSSSLKLMNRKICECPWFFCHRTISKTIISDTYGRVFAYDKSYDRITTKTERPLQLVDRIKYNTTTSDDPVIQQVCSVSFALI